MSQVHQAPQASGSGAQESSASGGATTSALPGGTAAPNLGNPVLDALVLVMQQLQTLQVNQLNTPKREDAPEAVKTAITDHTMDYVNSGDLATGNTAISTAPFFQDVPDRALSGILAPGGVEREPFWDALRAALPHLNRRRRKALHDSKNWVVQLFAGSKPHKPLLKLESNGTVVLELDVERSQAQNLYNDALWSLLTRAAREGRIAAVIGGPPCRTMSVFRRRPLVRSVLRNTPLVYLRSTLMSAIGVVCARAVATCRCHGREARESFNSACVLTRSFPPRTAPRSCQVYGSRKPIGWSGPIMVVQPDVVELCR